MTEQTHSSKQINGISNGAALALLTAFVFATNSIAAKLATLEVETFSIIFARSIVALVTLGGIMMFMSRNLFKLDMRDIPAVTILGVIGIVATLWFLLQALLHTSVANTALIGATAPIVTAIASAIVFQERLTPDAYAGIAVSFLGIVLLISNGDFSIFSQLSFNRGDMLMFGNVISSAIYALTIKRLSSKYASLTLTFYMTLAAILALAFLIDFSQTQTLLSVGAQSIGALIYLGVVGSAIGYFLYNYTVKLIGPTIMSCSVFSAMPVFVMVLAWFIIGETVSVFELASSALISVGLFLVLKPSKAPIKTEQE